MILDATTVNDQLTASASAMANLNAACQGILDTRIARSNSPWFGPLNAELQQAQGLASQWREQYATRLRSDVLTCVVHCGQEFQASRVAINQLFELAQRDPASAKAGLQNALKDLKPKTEMISGVVTEYEAHLRSWGQSLQQVHTQMAGTIHQIQSEAASLQAQISSINSAIASLQSEIIKDRQTIAEAKSERDKGVVETIFGIVFAPFTGGLSLILAGIGVSSIVEAESKVSAMENTIANYQSRIISNQQNLTQDQTQVATIQALTFSAGIALSDIEVSGQMLDSVRTSWDAFFQEMNGVITKIANAQNADAIILEQAWFNAACKEWDLIVTSTQGLIGTPLSTRSVTCGNCDVPVIRIVPTASHPPVPPDMKVTVLADPNGLVMAPNCPVLTWGDYTYWVVAYMDNREAMCFLSFDAANQIVKQVEKTGARYMWKMTLDEANKTVTCYGQANQQIAAALEELQIS